MSAGRRRVDLDAMDEQCSTTGRLQRRYGRPLPQGGRHAWESVVDIVGIGIPELARELHPHRHLTELRPGPNQLSLRRITAPSLQRLLPALQEHSPPNPRP